MTEAPALEAFFLPAHSGQRLCLLHRPVGALRGAVVHVHAFAEEMNKSRRMVAAGARALAAAGYTVLQIDLLGCGDASGELHEARWTDWLDDIDRAVAWLRARDAAHAAAPLWLWGHRAGALLAAEALARCETPAHLLLWQPVLQGRSVVQQMLRLKAAAAWQSGDGKGVIDQARADLAAGGAVDIAGYVLTPGLVQSFEQAVLKPPASPAVGDAGRRLVWLEVSGSEAALSPAAQAQQARWQAAGWQVHMQAVTGPAFWQTVEIEDAPVLVQATVAALQRSAPGPAQPAAPGVPTAATHP